MTLVKEYREELHRKIEAGEIEEHTKYDRYLPSMSWILEALVGQMPVDAIQAYCEEWGGTTDRRTVIRNLRRLALERRERREA